MERFGYVFIWETAGKQQTVGNYCFYADYLQKKGMLEQVRDFFVECGGRNGDTADRYPPSQLTWCTACAADRVL